MSKFSFPEKSIFSNKGTYSFILCWQYSLKKPFEILLNETFNFLSTTNRLPDMKVTISLSFKEQEDKFKLKDICNHFGWKFFATEHKKEIRLLGNNSNAITVEGKIIAKTISAPELKGQHTIKERIGFDTNNKKQAIFLVVLN